MINNFDLVVIGGGPGGYVAAIRASQSGMKTAIVEKEALGGVCLNWGCIPTKALLKSAEQMAFLNEGSKWGFAFEKLNFDFANIVQRSRKIAEKNSRGVDFLMKKNKIRVLRGAGTLADTSTVVVNDSAGQEIDRMMANHIIIATGGRPRMIPGVKLDRKRVLTSREALVMKKPPKSMVIIGAGSIGVEFGYFYHTFGTKVTLVEMMPHILPTADREISDTLKRIYEKAGISIYTGTRVDSLKVGKNKVTAKLSLGKGGEEVSADYCLAATGVQGNTEGLGLEKLGVAFEKNAIVTDKFMQTNVAGIYAVGDVVGEPCLAHVASHEAMVCVDNIAGKKNSGNELQCMPGMHLLQAPGGSRWFDGTASIECWI